jgi:hypothetical protein
LCIEEMAHEKNMHAKENKKAKHGMAHDARSENGDDEDRPTTYRHRQPHTTVIQLGFCKRAQQRGAWLTRKGLRHKPRKAERSQAGSGESLR